MLWGSRVRVDLGQYRNDGDMSGELHHVFDFLGSDSLQKPQTYVYTIIRVLRHWLCAIATLQQHEALFKGVVQVQSQLSCIIYPETFPNGPRNAWNKAVIVAARPCHSWQADLLCSTGCKLFK